MSSTVRLNRVKSGSRIVVEIGGLSTIVAWRRISWTGPWLRMEMCLSGVHSVKSSKSKILANSDVADLSTVRDIDVRSCDWIDLMIVVQVCRLLVENTSS